MLLKHLTLNTWTAQVPAIWDFLKKEDADILTLQEVLHTEKPHQPESFYQYQKIFQELGLQYGAFGALYHLLLDEGEVEFGNAIFSKYPITSMKTIYFQKTYQDISWTKIKATGGNFSQAPMGMVSARITLPEKKLDTYSIHGVWGFDGEDSEARLAMADTILSEIEGKEDIIIGGDMNLLPTTKAVAKLEEHLTSVFGNSLPTTFNLSYKDEQYATSPVDMMFVSKHIAVRSCEMPQVSVSDHMPLIATYTL